MYQYVAQLRLLDSRSSITFEFKEIPTMLQRLQPPWYMKGGQSN